MGGAGFIHSVGAVPVGHEEIPVQKTAGLGIAHGLFRIFPEKLITKGDISYVSYSFFVP